MEAARIAMKDADAAGHPLEIFHPPSRRSLSIGIGLELFDMEDMIRFDDNHWEIPGDEIGRPDFLKPPSDLCIHMIKKE